VIRKLLIITLPALVAGIVILLVGAEVWVRIAADPHRGRPGFFLSDPVRGDRLAPGYSGWFAGVPVHINSLGLRDDREYALEKKPNTFRILVLGDSVTFGHGAIYETSYPYLLERQLRKWRPDVDWQVWNAAVPGYNTSQELAQLLELGPAYKPDLVIIGFFNNDLMDNFDVVPANRLATLESDMMSFVKRHVYSLELYKRIYLALQWKLSASDEYRKRLEHLGTEEALLMNSGAIADMREQQITPYDRLTDEQVAHDSCVDGQTPNPALLEDMQKERTWPFWLRAVRRLQDLNRRAEYRIVFFLNEIPPVCPDGEIFYDGGSSQENEFLLRIMGDGTPALSVHDAFLHRRPSQMPNATAHAIGNSNLTKAEALFEYLRDHLLPTLAHPALTRVGADR